MTGLRIGIDATTWWNRRGFGRFTRQLLTAMFDDGRGHQFHLFLDQAPAEEMRRDNIQLVHVPTAQTVTESAVAEGHRQLRDLLAFRRSAMRQSLDVLYFPAVYSWFPSGGRVPSVITFHDAIAERFPQLVLPHFTNRLLWRAKVWAAKRSAAAITTVSDAARHELVEYLDIPAAQIEVVHEAAAPMFRPVDDPRLRREIRDRLGLPPARRLLLYVGGLAPHKNLAGLVRAYAAALRSGLENVDLVLAGDPHGAGFHSNHEELLAMIARDAMLEGRVHFPGFVPEADLPGLYSDALAVVMPAFSEGFGLPAAEAIACGTPVLATSNGAVAEFVGDAGLYFDPHRIEDIAETIRRIGEDAELEQELRRKCLQQASELSWERAAGATLDILERAARRR